MSEQAVEGQPISASLRVPFRDVDMHGHVHNATYLSYCEAAINEFLRHNKLSKHFSPKNNGLVYLVRKVELAFNGPSFFDEEIHFVVTIARLGSASIGFSVDVYGHAEATPRVTASVVWVCVNVAQRKSTGIPQETMAALAAASGAVSDAGGKD